MQKLITSTIALILIGSTAFAGDGHDHEKVIPGPKGGKVVEVEGGHAEFFVQPDKKASVTFFGEDMKPLLPAGQSVTLIAEAPSGKAKLEFEATPEGFVSKDVLPEGDGYRIVLQIRSTADAKPQNFRIEYHTEVCGKCNRAEYACTCAEDGHGH